MFHVNTNTCLGLIELIKWIGKPYLHYTK